VFSNVDTPKTVTVKVPQDATGYVPTTEPETTLPVTYSGNDDTEAWGNGFRGRGWDGSDFMDSGYINTYITLTIDYEGSE
jgi:hypothetical protein